MPPSKEINVILEENLNNLIAYKKAHGHCNVPKSHPNFSLYEFVCRCRSRRKSSTNGKLSPFLRRKLDELGFCWDDTAHTSFDQRLAELQAFHDEHGHLNIPYATQKPLYRWLWKQRNYEREGKLSKERKEQLDAIGKILWPERAHLDTVFDQHLAELQEFYYQHGHCNIPDTAHYPLYKWLLRKRHLEREGKLPKERKERLDAIGNIPWFPKEHEEESSTEDSDSDDDKEQDGNAYNADNGNAGRYTQRQEEHKENNLSSDKKSHVLRSKALDSSSEITGKDCRLWNRNDERESESEYTTEEDEEQSHEIGIKPTCHNHERPGRPKRNQRNNPPRPKTSKAHPTGEKPQGTLDEVIVPATNAAGAKSHGTSRRSPNLSKYYDQVHPVEESQRTLEEIDTPASNERGMKTQSTSSRRLPNLSTYVDQVHRPPSVARKRSRSNVPAAAPDETKSSLEVNDVANEIRQQATSQDTSNDSEVEKDTEPTAQQSSVASRDPIEAPATRKRAPSAPKVDRDHASDNSHASERRKRASSSSNGATKTDRKHSRDRRQNSATRKRALSPSIVETRGDTKLHPPSAQEAKEKRNDSSKKDEKDDNGDDASLLLLPLVDRLIRKNDTLRIDICSGFVAIIYARVMMQEGRPSDINALLNHGSGSTRLLFLTSKLLNLLETIPEERSLKVARRCSIFLKGHYHHTRKAKERDPALRMISLIDRMIMQVVSQGAFWCCIKSFEHHLLHEINPPPPGIRYCLPPSNYIPEWKLMCLAIELCDVVESSSGGEDFSDVLHFCKSKLKRELRMHVKAQQPPAAVVAISESESSESSSPPAAKRARLK